MELVPVPRVPRNQFRPSRLPGEPRVILDNIPEWTATTRWRVPYLKAVAGDREVAVRETNGPPHNMFQNLAEGGRVPFGDYLDWVVHTGRELERTAAGSIGVRQLTRAVGDAGLDVSYYLDAKLDQLSEALLAEAPAPDWYRSPPIDTNLWCGVLGTSSGLHCDITPNCNVQVIGRKHFILFPPWQSRLVYRIPTITHCRFDPNVPDFDAFPLARHASGWQCTLEPGDSLYLPVGWYHQVTVVSAWALNVNFFWSRPFPQGLVTPSLWRFLFRRGRARIRSSVGAGWAGRRRG
jgi:hypothetical protein